MKKTIFLLLIVVLMGVGNFGVKLLGNNASKVNEEITYTEFISDIRSGNVEKITINSDAKEAEVKRKKEDANIKVIIPDDQALIEFVQQEILSGNDIELVKKNSKTDNIFRNILYAIQIIVIGGSALMVFLIPRGGLSRKNYKLKPVKSDVTFSDIAGLKEEKEEMEQIVQFLKEPEKFSKLGAKIPRGVLLYGEPGTGKTLIAKAIAGESKVPFLSISGSEFEEMFVGVGASRIRKIFKNARKVSPCIIFIDEIDAVGSKRTNKSNDSNQTLNQLLVEMDGFNTDDKVVVIAATNRKNSLDEALLRPGRFDRHIFLGYPDLKGREDILAIHSKDKNFSDSVSLKKVAEETSGFTGAKLANILNEAAIIAALNSHDIIGETDVEEALKKELVGLRKNSRLVSEKDKNLTAYHEAGHAIVSRYLKTQEPVKEISIIPRGKSGGYTMYKTSEDKSYISITELEERLIALLGGRAAEKVALNEISTGAVNDIEVATKIAIDMVTVYGMSEKIGNIFINTQDNCNTLKILGNEYSSAIGKEIKNILDEAYETAKKLLIEHRSELDIVASELLAKETISHEEFEELFIKK